ncbi:hypothetical protein D9M72_358500 [compost metagenome]
MALPLVGPKRFGSIVLAAMRNRASACCSRPWRRSINPSTDSEKILLKLLSEPRTACRATCSSRRASG